MSRRIRMVLLAGMAGTLLAGYAAYVALSYIGYFGGGTRLTADLASSGEALGPSSFVKYHGLVVGRVIRVQGSAGHAQAQIVIDPGHAPGIPANVTARVLPATLFGSEYVDLVAPRTPAGPTGATIASVDTIAADTSPATARLMDSLAAADRILRAVRPGQLDATVSAVAHALDGRGADIARFVARSNSYLGALLAHSPAFYRDLHLMGDVAMADRDAAAHLVSALRSSSSTLQLITGRRQQLADLIDGVTRLASRTDAFLEAHGDDLSAVILASAPVMAIYAGHLDDLASLLRAVPQVLANGAHGIKNGMITMQGLLEPSGDFGHPYTRDDCTRYAGASAGNCPGGAHYTSRYGGQ